MYLKKVAFEIQKKIKELSSNKKLDNKRIYLFGYNIYTEHINSCLCNEDYRLYGIIDNNKEKQGKMVFDILISDPESINWKTDDIILIASMHENDMCKQIQRLTDKVEIIALVNMRECIHEWDNENRFWMTENYERETRKIYHGEKVYEKLKGSEQLIIVPAPSIGDAFLGGICFCDHKKMDLNNVKIIVVSKGVYKTTQLFGIKNVEIISKEDVDALLKFILFCGLESKENIIICGWMDSLTSMAAYKKLSFVNYYAKYVFKLSDNHPMFFPSIWDSRIEEAVLKKNGLVRNKSVILAPYANSVHELPIQFWELLTKKLFDMGYFVFTNIVGNQKVIKGSKGLDIPINQLGNYLEYAGYFVSLRSGLCDVVGRSKCKQIIIFRNQVAALYSSEIEFFDMHSQNVSQNANQYVYDDDNFYKNIDMILSLL